MPVVLELRSFTRTSISLFNETAKNHNKHMKSAEMLEQTLNIIFLRPRIHTHIHRESERENFSMFLYMKKKEERQWRRERKKMNIQEIGEIIK